ncbi:hypothetical protein AJ78_03141 [Emergomyces pasteurianus Ep9510]|uniref:Store-operated calcium entry-associated regulatory factor n=1 Tax=Emergomyces pasteurianus Ep9510 TaxID=1447872 RepID=A0A1J9QLF3_9EURO|nr:hypothetical protein AJ78_03141 [Emergomyces pasteurianus Ep9510]
MTPAYTTFSTLLFSLLSLLALLPTKAHAYNPSKAPSTKNAVLLSSIQTLTLHANRKTTHRRVPAIQQLTCVGPSKEICALYTPDVMRCINQGHDYDENDVQWTCTAQLPAEFKLGSTDVVCEGYRDKEDPWVLKGSCGVEYRLLLTEKGEEKYGELVGGGLGWSSLLGGSGGRGLGRGVRGLLNSLGETIFFLLFFVVLAVIVLAALGCLNGRAALRRGGRRWGWGWGGGWGAGGGGGGGGGGAGPGGRWNDPPPPYDYSGYRKSEPWRPGFWTGAAAGGAAAYAMGRRSGPGSRPGSGWGWGSSQAGSSRPSSSRPSFSPSTSESTGFGGSRRR